MSLGFKRLNVYILCKDHVKQCTKSIYTHIHIYIYMSLGFKRLNVYILCKDHVKQRTKSMPQVEFKHATNKLSTLPATPPQIQNHQ